MVFIAIALPLVIVVPYKLYLSIYEYNAEVNEAEFDRIIVQLKEENIQLTGQKKILCFFSPGCRYCQLAAKRLTVMSEKYNISPKNMLHLFFGKKEGMSIFYAREGITEVPHRLISPDDFLSITNGKMPVILLVEDGAIIDKFRYRSLNETRIADFLKP